VSKIQQSAMNKSPSSSISRPRWLQITSNDGSYMIQLSGLSIFVVILSSVAIALFSGRLASIYLPTWLQLQLRYRHVVPAQTVCPEKMINYEALVHPAMITHLNPKRVAVLNGNQRDTQTSARAMREVLKHVSVQEACIFSNIGEEEETLEVGAMRSVLVTTAQECSSGNLRYLMSSSIRIRARSMFPLISPRISNALVLVVW